MLKHIFFRKIRFFVRHVFYTLAYAKFKPGCYCTSIVIYNSLSLGGTCLCKRCHLR